MGTLLAESFQIRLSCLALPTFVDCGLCDFLDGSVGLFAVGVVPVSAGFALNPLLAVGGLFLAFVDLVAVLTKLVLLQ